MMSELILQRLSHDDKATQGELILDGEHLAYTLENRPPRVPGVKEPGRSRIPAGTYPLGLRDEGGFFNRYTERWNWHGPMVEIHLTGWKWVLFHVGNYHFNTDGCVLVGSDLGTHAEHGLSVWRSGAAYARTYPELLDIARQGGSLSVRDEVAS